MGKKMTEEEPARSRMMWYLGGYRFDVPLPRRDDGSGGSLGSNMRWRGDRSKTTKESDARRRCRLNQELHRQGLAD